MAGDSNLDGKPETVMAGTIPFVNRPADAPSYYADTCMFATDVGSTIRLQFTEAIPGALDSADPGLKLRYVGTLIMPRDGFENMMSYLNGILASRSAAEISDGN